MPTAPHHPSLAIDARWEKPFMPTTGGSATLMVRIAAPSAQPGERRAPIDLAFALDRSGSMAGQELALAKDAIDVAAAFLRDDDRCALVVYDHDVDVVQPLSHATARTKTAIRLALRGIDARGSTALCDGWLTACQQIAEAAPAPGAATRIRRALLLTDGQANVGIVDPGQLTVHANELRRRGIATSTLGVGQAYAEDLLTSMAEAGGGNFQHADGPDALRAIFERELGELLSVVAAGLSVTLTLPTGLRAQLLSPYPATRVGKRITVALGELPADQEISLIFAVTALRGVAGSVHTLGLEAAWADTLADRAEQVTVPVPPLLVAAPDVARAAAADPEVQEEAALQHAAHERREAMRLDREGHHAESRARLAESQVRLRASVQSDAVMTFLEVGDALLAAPAAAPFSESTRKRTVADAHGTSRRRPRREA